VILPTFFVHPRNLNATIRFNRRVVSLTCKAVEAFFYVWERQNGNISYSATGVNTTTLIFTDLHVKDAGYYRCKAINDAGVSFSKYAKIDIKVIYHRVQ